jgi:glutamine synthetase
MGIERRMTAPAPTEGDAYTHHPHSLPRFWPDALRAFETSEFVGEYIGTEMRRVLLMSKWQELEEFNSRISTLEYDSYLEL